MDKKEIFKKIKIGFDQTLVKNGMQNGYIILCLDDDNAKLIRIHFAGVVLSAKNVVIVGKMVQRAQEWYDEMCHAQAIIDLSEF